MTKESKKQFPELLLPFSHAKKAKSKNFQKHF